MNIVYPSIFKWSVLYISVRWHQIRALFRSSVSLFILCIFFSHYWKWELESPTILLVLSISPFSSVHVCFIYWALILGAYICKITVSSWWTDLFFIIECLLYVSFNNFYLKSILSDISIAILAPFWLRFGIFHFQLVNVLRSKVDLLEKTYNWILFFILSFLKIQFVNIYHLIGEFTCICCFKPLFWGNHSNR